MNLADLFNRGALAQPAAIRPGKPVVPFSSDALGALGTIPEGWASWEKRPPPDVAPPLDDNPLIGRRRMRPEMFGEFNDMGFPTAPPSPSLPDMFSAPSIPTEEQRRLFEELLRGPLNTPIPGLGREREMIEPRRYGPGQLI